MKFLIGLLVFEHYTKQKHRRVRGCSPFPQNFFVQESKVKKMLRVFFSYLTQLYTTPIWRAKENKLCRNRRTSYIWKWFYGKTSKYMQRDKISPLILAAKALQVKKQNQKATKKKFSKSSKQANSRWLWTTGKPKYGQFWKTLLFWAIFVLLYPLCLACLLGSWYSRQSGGN